MPKQSSSCYWPPQCIIHFQLFLSSASSSATPTICMCSLTTSINHLFELLPKREQGKAIFNNLPLCSSSLLFYMPCLAWIVDPKYLKTHPNYSTVLPLIHAEITMPFADIMVQGVVRLISSVV